MYIFHCVFFGTLFSVAAVFAIFKKHGLMWVWLKEGFFTIAGFFGVNNSWINPKMVSTIQISVYKVLKIQKP